MLIDRYPPKDQSGFYYHVPWPERPEYKIRRFLPLVSLNAHSTILSSTSRTVLTQHFTNPTTEQIRELTYTFPLFAGITVVGFECTVGDRVIRGIVKDRDAARAIFNEAVERGETAGLLERSLAVDDVFTTTIGNVPAGAAVTATVTYVGELISDGQIENALRFTIPTAIAPRYGIGEVATAPDGTPDPTQADGNRISLTVDVRLDEGRQIRKVSSSSHPVTVNMGETSDEERKNAKSESNLSHANVSLALGETVLGTDFVLQVVASDLGAPKALLETHPDYPGQRALMATFVPNFTLDPDVMPEIIFVCDRSGSMSGNIPSVVNAMHVFLRSLPVGCTFNICSFGTHHKFLFAESRSYSHKTLQSAADHVDGFAADFGGTEILSAVKNTISKRSGDVPLEMILLTDGEIWDQQAVFDCLNEENEKAKQPLRMFTLGIGNAVSHALIQGAAAAGNGFAQTSLRAEKLERNVVRMLKGALSPHVTDYSFEVKYRDEEKPEDDDWEMIEKVEDSLRVEPQFDTPEKTEGGAEKLADDETPIIEGEEAKNSSSKDVRVRINPPKLLQAPTKIPSIYPFIRTVAYIIIDPIEPQKVPKSVVFHGMDRGTPMKLEIPVEIVRTPDQTIHQLAARKAVLELEEGRGWLASATNDRNESLKKQYPEQYESLVRSEAVRLGERFQIAGKYTSFVAVESNSNTTTEDKEQVQDQENTEHESPSDGESRDHGAAFEMDAEALCRLQNTQAVQERGEKLDTFDSHSPVMARSFARKKSRGPSFEFKKRYIPLIPPGIVVVAVGLVIALPCYGIYVLGKKATKPISKSNAAPAMMRGEYKRNMAQSSLQELIRLQNFDGSWAWDIQPFNVMGVAANKVRIIPHGFDDELGKSMMVTMLAILWFEKCHPDEKPAWELLVAKAQRWIQKHDQKKVSVLQGRLEKLIEKQPMKAEYGGD